MVKNNVIEYLTHSSIITWV